MSWWGTSVVPRLVDCVCATPGMHKLRRPVCAGLQGQVLEVGFGSGLNLPHYPDAVQRVVAIEPSDVAWAKAQRRIAMSHVPVTRGGLDGQHLDLPDASVDSALSTFTLCTIPDLAAALSEIHRVLRPGGTFHFVEHGLAPQARVARWQGWLTPAQRRLAGGCHLNRPIVDSVRAAGFEDVDVSEFFGARPKALSYFSLGTATRP